MNISFEEFYVHITEWSSSSFWLGIAGVVCVYELTRQLVSGKSAVILGGNGCFNPTGPGASVKQRGTQLTTA
jgi:hypothetical protein